MSRLTIRTSDYLQEFEEKLDSLEFRYRRKILLRVYSYLLNMYYKQIELVNTSEHEAFKIICNRIEYNHHHTLGF